MTPSVETFIAASRAAEGWPTLVHSIVNDVFDKNQRMAIHFVKTLASEAAKHLELLRVCLDAIAATRTSLVRIPGYDEKAFASYHAVACGLAESVFCALQFGTSLDAEAAQRSDLLERLQTEGGWRCAVDVSQRFWKNLDAIDASGLRAMIQLERAKVIDCGKIQQFFPAAAGAALAHRTEASAMDRAPTIPSKEGQPEFDIETAAIAMLLEVGPNISEIARRLDIPRTTLASKRRFMEQYEKLRPNPGRIRRGTKTADGRVETDDDDDD